MRPVPGRVAPAGNLLVQQVNRFFNRVYNVFLHEPFSVDSLNGAVFEENRSIKTDSETFLCPFIGNANCLALPDPRPRCFVARPPDALFGLSAESSYRLQRVGGGGFGDA